MFQIIFLCLFGHRIYRNTIFDLGSLIKVRYQRASSQFGVSTRSHARAAHKKRRDCKGGGVHCSIVCLLTTIGELARRLEVEWL